MKTPKDIQGIDVEKLKEIQRVNAYRGDGEFFDIIEIILGCLAPKEEHTHCDYCGEQYPENAGTHIHKCPVLNKDQVEEMKPGEMELKKYNST